MLKLISLFSKSLEDYFKNIILVIPLVILLILFYFFSLISVSVNYLISNSLAATAWFFFFSLVYLLVLSFIFSGLVGIFKEIILKKKAGFRLFLTSAARFFLKNFVIMFILVLLYNIIRLAAQYGAFYIGKALSLSPSYALVIFVLIYFAGLTGIAIFFTFSNFYLVIKEYSIIKSIRSSFAFVRKNYPATLTLTLVFFIILYLIDMYLNYSLFNIISSAELIKTILIYPLLLLALSRFLISREKKK